LTASSSSLDVVSWPMSGLIFFLSFFLGCSSGFLEPDASSGFLGCSLGSSKNPW
jgi:hypothetical protein